MTQTDSKLRLLCSACLKWFPRGWFQRSGIGKRLSWCRDCVRMKQSAHSAKRRGAGVTHVPKEVFELLRIKQGNACWRCGLQLPLTRKDIHVDHREPIARGGKHDLDNLQLLHAQCNLSKGAKVG